ncbi:hypothetical protein [uncultured Bilophila sp.]|uniref:hypothetical protein n=1 Tax=uncultured Bilophila sp. TaxID=529385 RepID=UPI00280B89A6|nr:hypothetical protein [uncultured Bilophila sp.]
MKRFGVIGAALLLLSGCAADDTGTPSSLGETVSEAPAADASALAVTEGKMHTLSVELMTYQGGTNGAREYVVAQAKQACDSIDQEVYIENLTSETTWRGGRAELTFACVDKNDPRLKNK